MHCIHGVWYIQNDFFGIEVLYGGTQTQWTFYLHPQIDPNYHTIKYYAFDTVAQKQYFTLVTKIKGIWSKTWYHLAMLPQDDVQDAVDTMDMQFFQKVSGIWPKTAKRIILELKQTISAEDLSQLHIDEKLYKDIITSLKNFGYEAQKIKQILPDCPLPLQKDHLPEIMKWLIDTL